MRVLATNISAGLTATAFAAITLVGATAIGLAPSSVQAAAILDISSDGHLRGARNVEVDGKLYNVRFLDNACAASGSNCSEAAKYAFKDKQTANLAARALFNQVLLDVMLGNAKSNPDLTVGCGVSGICVTLIPYQKESDPDETGVPSFLALSSELDSGSEGFPNPPLDTAFIEGAPATGSFAGTPGPFSGGRFAARAASTGPTGNPGSNPPGSNPGPGDTGSPGGGRGPGGDGDPDDDPVVYNPGPQDPIVIFDPVKPIKVPEPSTLFIFGFALLAMAAFGARQTQTATNGNRIKRERR